MQPNPTPLIIVCISAGMAAFFSGIFALITTWITKRSEERRHLREIAVKTATEHWKFVFERNPQSKPTIDILGTIMMNAMTMVSMAERQFKKDDEIRQYLKDGLRKVDIATEVFMQHRMKEREIEVE